jgi:hypothetical protein
MWPGLVLFLRACCAQAGQTRAMRVLECVVCVSATEFVRNNEAAGGSGSGCACPPASCGFESETVPHKKKAAAAAVLPVCVCRSCSSEFVFAIYVVCDEPMPETACVCAPGVGCSDL